MSLIGKSVGFHSTPQQAEVMNFINNHHNKTGQEVSS